MSSNIEDQSFWPKLSYSSQQQARELIRLKKRLTLILYSFLITFIIAIINLLPFFLGRNNAAESYVLPTIVFLLIGYMFSLYISSSKKEFEEVKKHVIGCINTEFCTCSEKGCKCKEDYIRFMNEINHINLCY